MFALLIISPLAPGQSLPEIDRAQFRQDVEFLASAPRVPGGAHHEAAGALCESRFAALGYEVEWQRGENEQGTAYANVIGKRLGVKQADREIIISAHYDSTSGCRGADDNASGVAGVLEAARLLASGEYERTATVACWDAEETQLSGSAAFAAAARQARKRIEVVYVFEMIGYVNAAENSQQLRPGMVHLFPIQYGHLEDNAFRGDFILLLANPGARKPAKWVRAEMLRQGGKAILLQQDPRAPVPPDFMRSDHYPFWVANVPAIMISDSAELRNPNYHCQQGEDVPSSLDYEFAQRVVAATAHSAARMLKPAAAK